MSKLLSREFEFSADVDIQTRITIPKTLRNLFQIKPGDIVVVKLIDVIHSNSKSLENRA